LVIGGLLLIAAASQLSIPGRVAPAAANLPQPPGSGRSLYVSRSDLRDDWPLTVDAGYLNCPTDPSSGVVAFYDGSRYYAVNGLARSVTDYPDIDAIWADNPISPGIKKDIGPLIDRGLALCLGEPMPTPPPTSTPVPRRDLATAVPDSTFAVLVFEGRGNEYPPLDKYVQLPGGDYLVQWHAGPPFEPDLDYCGMSVGLYDPNGGYAANVSGILGGLIRSDTTAVISYPGLPPATYNFQASFGCPWTVQVIRTE
jgi:hypothetical protein